MNINRTIFAGIEKNTGEWGFEPREVQKFLTEPKDFLTRQADAIKIIEDIMTAHGKKKLRGHVVQLAKVEHGIGELEPWVRDHVVHALLSFLVGVFIHEHFLAPGGYHVDPFQWKLAGLFHDVGYPAQIARDILSPFTDQINHISRDLSVTRPDVYFRLIPVGLEKLTNKVNGLNLIQKWLDKWRLKIDAKKEYKRMVNSGDICHGMISALSILCVVDMMYQKYNPTRNPVNTYELGGINWSQSCFQNDVVPACAAVFIHNLPERCFRSARLDRNYATLPFLLRLSDCLQDWDRPSAGNPSGFPNSDYNIEVASGRLTFTVANPTRGSKIAEDVSSALVDADIEVVRIEK